MLNTIGLGKTLSYYSLEFMGHPASYEDKLHSEIEKSGMALI